MQEVVSNNEHAHYFTGPVHDTILSTGNIWMDGWLGFNTI